MSRSLSKSRIDFHETAGAYYTKNPFPVEAGYDIALQHREGTPPVLAAKVTSVFSTYVIAFSNCGKCSAYIGDCMCEQITVPNSVRHIVRTYGTPTLEENKRYLPYSEQMKIERKQALKERLRKSRVKNAPKEKRIQRRTKPAPVSTEETP